MIVEMHRQIIYPIGATFDYRITDTAAGKLRSELSRWAPDVRVVVDDHVTDELPEIPCASLWEL
ncbi:hypothetical protein AB0H71_14345 [Nocardia sp. NPDC050697]|uniref:hypothetical protein n=1 Tax=Nocardia sp. NPDC050697 TaxID=3155158 RepID=UPI0033F36C93